MVFQVFILRTKTFCVKISNDIKTLCTLTRVAEVPKMILGLVTYDVVSNEAARRIDLIQNLTLNADDDNLLMTPCQLPLLRLI